VGVAIVGSDAFLHALAGASSVSLSAYTLVPVEPVVRALEDAGDRGARVSVTLEGHPYAGSAAAGARLERENRATAEALRRHGVDVHLTAPGEPPVHMKAALVDATAFLDDRNWTPGGRDLIVSTSDPENVRTVAEALAGRPAADAELATEKTAALNLEADAIRRGAGAAVELESETFGSSAVSHALRERAARGDRVRVLVAQREFAGRNRGAERSVLRGLARAGVEVRVCGGNDKLCVAGDRGWVGSANATYASTPASDWGLATRDPDALAALHATFERNWTAGRPAFADPARSRAYGPKSALAVAEVVTSTTSWETPNSSASSAAVAFM
jgi:phosphatidylserine/phosphatidylglycerophosphate/cardiolipin synthase-like enzyme